jgi:hypothetical protein
MGFGGRRESTIIKEIGMIPVFRWGGQIYKLFVLSFLEERIGKGVSY